VAEDWSFAEERRLARAEALALRVEVRAMAEPVTVPPAPLLLYATCPRCGGELHVIAPGRPMFDGRELRYAVGCSGTCRPLVIRFAMQILAADQWEDAADRSRAS
jgi:hypothetical protein